MMFNVDTDVGFMIKGYAVPDGYDTYCNVVLRSEGRDLLVIPANGLREVKLVPGRHVDSNCGFYVDESQLDVLSQLSDLELLDQETGVSIYRRRKPEHTQSRVFRLESHLLPLWRIDNKMNSRFQYWGTQIERHGRETIGQIFHLVQYDSAYISGRLTYPSVRQWVEEIFRVAFIMHHPYEELAERLIVLRQIADRDKVLSSRDATSFAPIMAFARSLPLHDEAALTRALRETPRGIDRILANPVTRQLTCEQFDQTPGGRALTTALDTLASFEIVGLRRSPAPFLNAIAEVGNISPDTMPPLSTLPGVTTLAKALKRSREFDGLLELDLQVYAHVAAAYKKAGQVYASSTMTLPKVG